MANSQLGHSMYYIAILAPGDINEKLLEWKKFMRDHFNCKAALKSPAHITLIIPFWMEGDDQPALENALKTYCDTQRKFDILLSNFNSFKPRVIYVDVMRSGQLAQLRNDLEAFLAKRKFPVKKSNNEFHPHITIATRDLRKKDFAEAWKHFENKQYEAYFTATGLTIMKHSGTAWSPIYSADFT